MERRSRNASQVRHSQERCIDSGNAAGTDARNRSPAVATSAYVPGGVRCMRQATSNKDERCFSFMLKGKSMDGVDTVSGGSPFAHGHPVDPVLRKGGRLQKPTRPLDRRRRGGDGVGDGEPELVLVKSRIAVETPA